MEISCGRNGNLIDHRGHDVLWRSHDNHGNIMVITCRVNHVVVMLSTFQRSLFNLGSHLKIIYGHPRKQRKSFTVFRNNLYFRY